MYNIGSLTLTKIFTLFVDISNFDQFVTVIEKSCSYFQPKGLISITTYFQTFFLTSGMNKDEVSCRIFMEQDLLLHLDQRKHK